MHLKIQYIYKSIHLKRTFHFKIKNVIVIMLQKNECSINYQWAMHLFQCLFIFVNIVTQVHSIILADTAFYFNNVLLKLTLTTINKCFRSIFYLLGLGNGTLPENFHHLKNRRTCRLSRFVLFVMCELLWIKGLTRPPPGNHYTTDDAAGNRDCGLKQQLRTDAWRRTDDSLILHVDAGQQV